MDLEGLRKASGMRQAEIAEEIGITRAAYANIENRKRRPSVDVAKRIAAVLGFPWTRFYEDAENAARTDGAE